MIDDLDAVLELYRRRSEATRDAALAKVKTQADERSRCGGPLLAAARPVLMEVAEKVRLHGHAAEVQVAEKPWASVLLTLELAGRSAQASSFYLECAAGTTVRCAGEVWGPGSRRWTEDVPLEALTAEKVRELALRFVRRVLEQW
ncbi:MAG TPA: hypothetical protein VLH75_20565 [Longimicrobiales bacterium]|nr:hypothetical protein [Longimicrobiales bacterium]